VRYLIGILWLRLTGWRLEGLRALPPKAVIVCAPHTSNWDLPYMLAIAWTLGIRVSWVGKHTLFRGPAGWVLRALGGIAIDRRAPQGMVARVAQIFRERDGMLLGVPPEGTRAKVTHWKSGFYHMARAANVPVGLGFLDFARKAGGIGRMLTLTGDFKKDMDEVRAFYKDVRGKYPAQESPPLLKEESPGVEDRSDLS